jgi:hypothetical protein
LCAADGRGFGRHHAARRSSAAGEARAWRTFIVQLGAVADEVI